LSVTIKRVDLGLMSNWLPDNLKAGDTVKVMEPMGHFTTEYKSENKRHVIMFAGGSGITPMMSLIKEYTYTRTGKYLFAHLLQSRY
jgi:ring-1,2-phenylacetyl-CoA epoxidase subunit PaaE